MRKVIGVKWYPHSKFQIGIVLVFNEDPQSDNTFSAYIGATLSPAGDNDIISLVKSGSPFPVEAALELVPIKNVNIQLQ